MSQPGQVISPTLAKVQSLDAAVLASSIAYVDASIGVVSGDLGDHVADTNNPHEVTKSQVGLGSVDNVSAASLRDRSTHTGTQPVSTISDIAGNYVGVANAQTISGTKTFSAAVNTPGVSSIGATKLGLRSGSLGGTVALQTSNGIDALLVGGHNAPNLTFFSNLNLPITATNLVAGGENNLVNPVSPIIRLAFATGTQLTGIGSPASGQLKLFFIAGGTGWFRHESASSDAANRFILPANADFQVASGDIVFGAYDGISSRWRFAKL
jgi:hypothetical protein